MKRSQKTPKAHKKHLAIKIFSFVLLAVTATAMGLVFSGINNAVGEFSTEIARHRADVILASAELDEETVVSVPILYYDQKMDECVNMYDADNWATLNNRQFEWKSCGYYTSEIETGMVKTELDSQYLPVAVGGNSWTNRGVIQTNFKRWFSQVDGANKSYAGTLNLSYNPAIASFRYTNEEFYPLDEIASSELWEDGHNHLFTLNLGLPFQVLANGEEKFTVTADDDTWVFIGKDLVLDMGGIHGATAGSFKITENGEVHASIDEEDFAYTGVKLFAGEGAIVRIFHADRNSEDSVFKLNLNNMVPNITNSSLARSDGGVEVAYDPMDPSYVAPLGESLRVDPDHTKSLTLVITIQAMLMGMLAVILVATTSLAWRYWRHDRSQEK